MNSDPMGDVLDLMRRIGDGQEQHQAPVEPVKWMHKGLTCHILSGGFGALCGYVNIPKESVFYGVGIWNEPVTDLNVHGGVTFAQESRLSGKGWWIGFDTMHPGDAWTFDMVKAETNRLAEQISNNEV